jgi:hypothetical protein
LLTPTEWFRRHLATEITAGHAARSTQLEEPARTATLVAQQTVADPRNETEYRSSVCSIAQDGENKTGRRLTRTSTSWLLSQHTVVSQLEGLGAARGFEHHKYKSLSRSLFSSHSRSFLSRSFVPRTRHLRVKRAGHTTYGRNYERSFTETRLRRAAATATNKPFWQFLFWACGRCVGLTGGATPPQPSAGCCRLSRLAKPSLQGTEGLEPPGARVLSRCMRGADTAPSPRKPQGPLPGGFSALFLTLSLSLSPSLAFFLGHSQAPFSN